MSVSEKEDANDLDFAINEFAERGCAGDGCIHWSIDTCVDQLTRWLTELRDLRANKGPSQDKLDD